MKKLKACPFCGQAAMAQKTEGLTFPAVTKYCVGCDHYKCEVKPCVTSYAHIDDAAAKWNRRNALAKHGEGN